MNVGTICYDCHSGLGHLAKSFFDAGLIQRVMIIRHPRYPRVGWFPPGVCYSSRDAFVNGLDVLLIFENAFKWDVVKCAKARGTKLVIMPNYEYSPFPPPVKPDLVWCPSLLDRDYYKEYPHCVLPPPVDIPWRLRNRASVFVHNAGHGQRGWAKGTPRILGAMQYVKSPIRLIVRGQPEEPRVRALLSTRFDDPRIEVRMGEVPKIEDLWKEGDVFINAEQYNGLSLMLQEARAAGMLVMTTDRYPINTWLPKEPLIPVARYVKDKISVQFDRAVVDIKNIAKKIDDWYNRDITQYSQEGKQWAEEHGWDTLRPKFVSMLEGVCA